MLVGRPQNILGLNVRTESNQERPDYLRVYWSMPPKREPSREGEKSHPADVLVDAVRQPEEFSRILEDCLNRHDGWCNARLRFFNSFPGQNYFVHGAVQRFDYGTHFNLVSFFTETLEFVFAASDLIESGWDIAAWANIPTSMSHPFARFRIGYAEHLRELKSVLGS